MSALNDVEEENPITPEFLRDMYKKVARPSPAEPGARYTQRMGEFDLIEVLMNNLLKLAEDLEQGATSERRAYNLVRGGSIMLERLGEYKALVQDVSDATCTDLGDLYESCGNCLVCRAKTLLSESEQ
jgi:hypothetical protein